MLVSSFHCDNLVEKFSTYDENLTSARRLVGFGKILCLRFRFWVKRFMGVQGLWSIIESTGQPVNIQSLKGKVLAIDVSIWLHQSVKGFRDKDGNPLPNAHLLGVFHRICKLLNYGVRPVFVFDGGVPFLKRQTMSQRKQRKLEAQDKSDLTRAKLLSNYIRQQIQKQTKQALPATLRLEAGIASPSPKKNVSPKGKQNRNENEVDSDLEELRHSLGSSTPGFLHESDYEDECSDSSSDDIYKGRDYSEHFSTITSPNFDNLSLEAQHEILFQMQESKKTNSWNKMHEMPRDPNEFSSFQLDRLRKRRFLHQKIKSVQQEMGQRHIHVQNLDDLAEFEAEFGTPAEEIKVIGSKEKGALLIQSKLTPGSSPRAGTSREVQPEVITIDDYVEEWSSSDEEGVGVKEVSKGNSAVYSKKQTEEEAQLELAIKLSLENCGPKDLSTQKESSAAVKSESVGASPKVELMKPSSINRSICSSPTKAFKVSRPEPEASGTALHNGFQQAEDMFSPCYKFLGWVGFSDKATVSPPKKVRNREAHLRPSEPVVVSEESSDSGTDFEDVDELAEMESAVEVTSGGNSPPMPEQVGIVFKVDTESLLKREDDLFADIFDNRNETNSNRLTLEPTKELNEEKASETIPIEKEGENILSEQFETQPFTGEEGAEWGSDPEVTSDLEEILSQETGPAIESKASPLPEVVAPKPRNQQITRTLGLIPSQGSVHLITAEFLQAQQKLNTEQGRLRAEKGLQERVAASITDQMYVEAQELLSLFGIPFVVSPMEAESQCAFLDTACLTDGTITDDSDVWLFGARRVYKNFFSSSHRHVEFYQYANIVQELNLTREKLILLALLTGSDYTNGVEGVGPVTALEIISEFPSDTENALDGLVKFHDWWELNQGRQGVIEAENKTREKFRKLKLNPGFPNQNVYEAYKNPTVDPSTETFRWGNPELDSLRQYTKHKFGWDELKCDSVLKPVMKNFECQAKELSRQTTLDSFVTLGPPALQGSKRTIKSRRVIRAIKILKKGSASAPQELNLSTDSDSESDTYAGKHSTSRARPKKPSQTISTSESESEEEQIPGPKMGPGNMRGGDLKGKIRNTNVRIPKQAKDIPVAQKTKEENERQQNKLKAIEVLKKKKKGGK